MDGPDLPQRHRRLADRAAHPHPDHRLHQRRHLQDPGVDRSTTTTRATRRSRSWSRTTRRSEADHHHRLRPVRRSSPRSPGPTTRARRRTETLRVRQRRQAASHRHDQRGRAQDPDRDPFRARRAAQHHRPERRRHHDALRPVRPAAGNQPRRRQLRDTSPTATSAARQLTTTTVAGGGETAVWSTSSAGHRERRVKTFDGRTATTYTDYDPLGRAPAVSRPTLPGESAAVHHDRSTTTAAASGPSTAPDGAQVRHEYLNRETHTYDGRDVHDCYTVDDVDGEVDVPLRGRPELHRLAATRFEYGPFGETDQDVVAAGRHHTDHALRRRSAAGPR